MPTLCFALINAVNEISERLMPLSTDDENKIKSNSEIPDKESFAALMKGENLSMKMSTCMRIPTNRISE